MDVVDAICGRRSIRDFTSADTPDEEIEDLIQAATLAPNGMNLQPWAFVVAHGRERLAKWSKLAKAQILAIDAAPDGLIEHLRAETFDIFYNAATLVVICATDSQPMSLKDCCLAAENLMLAAYNRGYGTCWIGFAEAWLASPEGRTELGLAKAWVPVAPIILGRPRSAPDQPPRNPPMIHWIETEAVVAA